MLSFLRKDGNEHAVMLLSLTPVPRHAYRVGVPVAGCHRELMNSDSRFYGGTDVCNPMVET